MALFDRREEEETCTQTIKNVVEEHEDWIAEEVRGKVDILLEIITDTIAMIRATPIVMALP